MEKRNLTKSEAAKLQHGDRVIYDPAMSGQPFSNPKLSRGLKPGETYTVVGVNLYGMRRFCNVIGELSPEDLVGRTLTNVPLVLEGIPGMRWYSYFRNA